MIPIGRPFLDYVLSAAADAGYPPRLSGDRAGARRHPGVLRRSSRRAGCDFAFACQEEPKGTADAVAAARRVCRSRAVCGDQLRQLLSRRGVPRLARAVGLRRALFERDAMLAGGNVPAERIKRFAVAKIDALGRLERILEKPDEATLAALPKPLWLSMNCWRFGPSIFEACRAIRPSPRGEYEITDAVQHAISALGETFRCGEDPRAVLDLTSRDDIASVAALLDARRGATVTELVVFRPPDRRRRVGDAIVDGRSEPGGLPVEGAAVRPGSLGPVDHRPRPPAASRRWRCSCPAGSRSWASTPIMRAGGRWSPRSSGASAWPLCPATTGRSSSSTRPAARRSCFAPRPS